MTPCSNKTTKADFLEEVVWNRIKEALLDPELILAELARQQENSNHPALTDALDLVEERLKRLKDREVRMVRLYSYGEIDDALLEEEVKAIKRERKTLDDERRRLNQRIEQARALGDYEASVRAYCALVSKNIESFDFEDQRLALEAMQVRVLIHGSGIAVEGAIPASVATPHS